MSRHLTPLEILNLYYSEGASLGNASNELWLRFNDLLSWDNLIEKNFQGDMAPFLYYIISKALPRISEKEPNCRDIQNRLPENALLYLKTRHKISLFRNMIFLEELKRIAEVLSHNNIRSIPLKGAYLAENVYEDIACRPMSDLDILVKDCDKQHAFKLLSMEGYHRVDLVPSSREIHDSFIKEIAGQQVLVEVHNRLVKNKFRKRFDLNEVFERGHIPFHFQMLYFCWHTVHHGVMRFIWLCDLAELLRQHRTGIGWEYFDCMALGNNVKQETAFIFHLVSVLLSPPALKGCPMKIGYFRRFILEKVFLKGKKDWTAQNEARQRYIMGLVLMKPLDAAWVVPHYLAEIVSENRRNAVSLKKSKNDYRI